MPAISDPVLVKWCNETIRPTADRLTGATVLIDQILIDVMPAAKNFAAALTAAGPTDLIADGSPADGRTPMSVAQLQAFIVVCEKLQAFADNDQDPTTGAHTGITSRQLLHAVAVNPRA